MNLRKLPLLPPNLFLILLAINSVNKQAFLLQYFENLVKSAFVVDIQFPYIINSYDQI